jgi:hypothetical protein
VGSGAALTLRFVTVARNSTDGTGYAGGILTGGTTALFGTILARNTASSAADCSGPITTFGGNVFGPAAGCAVTLAASDRRSRQPRLGSFGDHGGPTPTIPLKAGSIALDRLGKTPCQSVTKVDQRGVHRPQGNKCDSGAYERKI